MIFYTQHILLQSSRVLKGRTIEGTNGLSCFEGRPGNVAVNVLQIKVVVCATLMSLLPPHFGTIGAQLPPYDFAASRAKLEEKYTASKVSDYDVMSHAMYPSVFDEFKEKQAEYGKVRKCRM
jgi:pyruvate carboxylase